ncbi:hypothetical protein [Pyrobaculum ferrireducens]|uniref:Uncharacterized protein n=1 Tax=Pyrobaculum ferrireducens TaxID=1104324 RepID=G7VFC9_9CREN|nr:hypothetical protein P186_1516 [Pyrobaculum ferrireducens]
MPALALKSLDRPLQLVPPQTPTAGPYLTPGGTMHSSMPRHALPLSSKLY